MAMICIPYSLKLARRDLQGSRRQPFHRAVALQRPGPNSLKGIFQTDSTKHVRRHISTKVVLYNRGVQTSLT